MPRSPDLPCSDCGKMLWRKKGQSLPPGEATCRPCRRKRRPPGNPHPAGCRSCGGRKPSKRHIYCAACKKHTGTQMPGRTTALGYGHQHQQLRKRLVPLVAQGGFVCTRFGHPQFPDCPGLIPEHNIREAADIWELGHDDEDKSRYTGPEHKACNRRAGGLKRIGALIQNQTELHW